MKIQPRTILDFNCPVKIRSGITNTFNSSLNHSTIDSKKSGVHAQVLMNKGASNMVETDINIPKGLSPLLKAIIAFGLVIVIFKTCEYVVKKWEANKVNKEEND